MKSSVIFGTGKIANSNKMLNLHKCNRPYSLNGVTLLLDDWGLAALTDSARRDLLEIVDDRHEARSTIVTSQLPLTHWHEAIGDSTLADAILDRLMHNEGRKNESHQK